MTIPRPDSILRLLSLEDTTNSEILLKLNYGMLEVHGQSESLDQGGSPLLRASIRDINGEEQIV